MLKNRTIAIAISSALLALSQVGAAPAATPLATTRTAAKPANPVPTSHPPGDFDRAFIAQQTRESQIERLQPGHRDPRRGMFTQPGSTPAALRK
jgi:hypothetical protein